MRSLPALVGTSGRLRAAAFCRLGLALLLLRLGGDAVLVAGCGAPWHLGRFLVGVPIVHHVDPVRWRWWLSTAWAVCCTGVGVWLAARRLRDAGLRPWFVGLWFVPLLKLPLLLVLALLPSRSVGNDELAPRSLRVALVAAALAALCAVGGLLAGPWLWIAAALVQGYVAGRLTSDRPQASSWWQMFLSLLLCTSVLLVAFGSLAVLVLTLVPFWLALASAGVFLGRSHGTLRPGTIDAGRFAIPDPGERR